MTKAALHVLVVVAFFAVSVNLSHTSAQEEPLCNVSGTWAGPWGDMTLSQSGSGVNGSYTWDEGRVEGSLSGLTFTGRWLEAPSYSAPDDAGDVEFFFSEDCGSFTGRWRYGSSGSWFTDWWGTSLTATPILTPTPTPAATPSPSQTAMPSPTPTASPTAVAPTSTVEATPVPEPTAEGGDEPIDPFEAILAIFAGNGGLDGLIPRINQLTDCPEPEVIPGVGPVPPASIDCPGKREGWLVSRRFELEFAARIPDASLNEQAMRDHLGRATYMAGMVGPGGEPLFPSIVTTMPLIKKMADLSRDPDAPELSADGYADLEEEALADVQRMLELLAANDALRWEDRFQ